MPEIGPPGPESGGRKRAHGNRTAARLRKHRMSHQTLPATRLLSTLHESGQYAMSEENASNTLKVRTFAYGRSAMITSGLTIPAPPLA